MNDDQDSGSATPNNEVKIAKREKKTRIDMAAIPGARDSADFGDLKRRGSGGADECEHSGRFDDD